MAESNQDQDKFSTRRQFLKAGAVSGGIGIIGVVKGSRIGTTEIVFARNKDGVAVKREVPTQWYRHKERVEETVRRYADQLSQNPAIAGVGIGNGRDTIRGYRKKVPTVTLDPNEVRRSTNSGGRETVPNSLGGHPVRISEADRLRPQTSTEAGEVIKTESTNVGSISCQVSYEGPLGNDSLSDAILTARHTFVGGSHCGSGNQDPVGDPVEYLENGVWEEIGEIYAQHDEHDVVIVDTDTDVNATADIVSEQAQFDGYLSADAMAVISSFSIPVEVRGATSGASSTTVREYDNRLYCPNSWEHLMELVYLDDAPTLSGDSGGAIYFEDGQDAYHAAMVHGLHQNYEGSDRTIGPATYALHNFYNITPY